VKITVGQAYSDRFTEILDEQQIGDPAVFLDVDVFDEYPVYSFLDQLDFLSKISFSEANVILIRLAALYLERVVSYAAKRKHAGGKVILRMLSINGWLQRGDSGQMNFDGSADFMQPYIWRADLDDPKLSNFTVWPAVSPAGLFVKASMGNDDRFAVAEGPPDKFGAPSPARVYIYMPGSEGTGRLLSPERDPV
jgi:hypothetical protein